MNSAYTVTQVVVELEDIPLAAPGGEGTVYRVKNGPAAFTNYCAKIYHPPKRTPARKEKIRFMIQHRPQTLTSANFVICWPLEMLLDKNSEFIGFLMPLAFAGSEKLYELTTPRIPQRLETEWGKFDRATQSGMEKRWKICVNLAIAIHSIHLTEKYVIVDYKPQNILITKEGQISITDVDSFQISANGAVLFHAEVVTPEYSPPESEWLNPAKNLVRPTWDRFSLAVSFYEILFGIHPFAATGAGQYQTSVTISEKIKDGLFVHGSRRPHLSMIPPLHDNFKTLPISLEQLFLKVFEDGYATADLRPTAEQWGKTIHAELTVKTGIKPNSIFIQAKTRPPGVVSIPQPVAATPIKKEDYMIWKVLTGALAAAVLILGIMLGSTNSKLGNIRSLEFTVAMERYKLKAQVDTLQSSLDAVSATYPIIVKEITFNNVDVNNTLLQTATHYFSQNTVQYVQPVITYNSNLSTEAQLTLFYIYRDPYGTVRTVNNSPGGYTWSTKVDIPGSYTRDATMNLAGYSFGFSSSPPGRYQVEIWCKGEQIGRSYFYVRE